MKIIIDLPEVTYHAMRHNIGFAEDEVTRRVLHGVLYRAVTQGTPIQDGHGRIIDVSDVESKIEEYVKNGHALSASDIFSFHAMLDDAKTIIEADPVDDVSDTAGGYVGDNFYNL